MWCSLGSVQLHMSVRIPARLNGILTITLKSWSGVSDPYFTFSFIHLFPAFSAFWAHYQCTIFLSDPLDVIILISILVVLLLFLVLISVLSASWAHMGVQIPLRPPQRREETPGWGKRRQLPDVRQMASSTACAATLKQITTRNSKTETENLLSISTSLATAMLLLYITVSACTTSSSPPGRRRPSLTEKITSSLQTRWSSTCRLK